MLLFKRRWKPEDINTEQATHPHFHGKEGAGLQTYTLYDVKSMTAAEFWIADRQPQYH